MYIALSFHMKRLEGVLRTVFRTAFHSSVQLENQHYCTHQKSLLHFGYDRKRTKRYEGCSLEENYSPCVNVDH